MKMLSDFQAGATVKYHGEPCIVLEHRKDGTLLMVLEQIEHTFGSDNDFAKSDLREHLNGAYMDTLTQGSHGEILKRAIDLTAVNGSKQYGIDTCCIAPLTFDEYRKYHDIIPKPEKWEWSVLPEHVRHQLRLRLVHQWLCRQLLLLQYPRVSSRFPPPL